MDPNKEIIPSPSTKETVRDVKKTFKRRSKLLILTPLLFVALSFVYLHVTEPKFESKISILVENEEEPFNPLAMFNMTLEYASEDRLKSFNEIIYSRSTIEKLVDSLSLNEGINSEVQKQELVNKLKKNIKTDLRASDAFEISYFDTDPVRARDGVALIADIFIDTRLKLDNRRKDETVKFFQTKINELENIVDDRQEEILNSRTEQLRTQPADQTALQTRLQDIDNQLDDFEWQIIQEENKLEILNEFLNQDPQNFLVQPLYRLSLGDIPLGVELGKLLEEHNQLSEQFTSSYPQLRSLRTQIFETVKRIPPTIESKLSNLKMQQQKLNEERTTIINDMEKTFVAAQREESQQSDFSIYQELYSDMKVKLEQARMAQEVGDQASEQFVVLDSPYVSDEPVSPDRVKVVAAGFIIGLVIGSIFVGITELFDTTVRSEKDLEFQKPIIAYLKDG